MSPADGTRSRPIRASWRPLRPLVTRVPVTVKDPHRGAAVERHPRAGPLQGRCRASRSASSTGWARTSTIELPEVVRQLKAGIAADDAVLDGILTTEATRSGEGTALIQESRSSVDGLPDVARGIGARSCARTRTSSTSVALVTVDLLRVDGQTLLDIPLLERKRLLEGVVVPSERVRRLGVHASAGRDLGRVVEGGGLRGAMMKGANSRYVPGGYSADWRTVTQIAAGADDADEPLHRHQSSVRWPRCPTPRCPRRFGTKSSGSARPTSWSASRASRTPPRSATWSARRRPASCSTSPTCAPCWSTPTPARRTARSASWWRPSRPTTSSASCSCGRATSSSASA